MVKTNKWDVLQIDDFQKNINREEINKLDSKLNDIDINLVNENTINSFVGDLCSIFIESARTTFGTKTFKVQNTQRTSKIKNKPWFDGECRVARKKYRKLKRIFKSKGSRQRFMEMKNAEKVYKNILE